MTASSPSSPRAPFSLPALFIPPVFDDEDQTQRARVLYLLVRTLTLVVAVILLATVAVQPELAFRSLAALFTVVALGLIVLEINRRGMTRTASLFYIAGLVAVVTVMAIRAGGIRSPGVMMYFVFVLMAGLLLGMRAGVATALICAGLGLGYVLAEKAGLLPAPSVHYVALVYWLLNCLYMGLVIFLMRLGTQTIRKALRRAQYELAERRQTERQLAMALDAGAIGLWKQDLRSGEFRASDRTFEVFGIPATADHLLPTEAWRKAVHPDDLPAVDEFLKKLAQGAAREHLEFRILQPNGAIRYIETAASLILDESGQPEHIVGMNSDVTERTEAELEQAKLVSALGERVKELRLLHAAAQLLHARPYSRDVLEELVDKIPSAWACTECCEARITYLDVEVSTRGWRDSAWRQSAPFATGAGKGLIEVVYLEERAPAAEGPFLAEERALIDSLAEMLAAYLERDRMERERLEFEKQLRQAQKMEALGTLAGGIAHDFNNILTALGGNAELARMHVPSGHPARIYLDEIARANARAADMVKRILLFSRRQESERRVIDLQPVIDEALNLLRASLPAMIQIRKAYATESARVSADTTQIHQIIMNLGTNAGYAMSEKGGTLSVELDRITVSADDATTSAHLPPGEWLRLTVGDTGTGMSEEILNRLFEPFFTTKGHDGTGLGLSVVHGIVSDHGGVITVESRLGRGTTFRIYFPSAAPTADQRRSEEGATILGGGEHIMYVDDEEPIIFIMGHILERLGYRFTGYSDPATALQAFRTNPHGFDAVITDLSMPKMSGLDLIRAIHDIRPDLRVALASGYGGDGAAADASAAIAARIQKPVTLDELGRTLHVMFRNSL